MSRSPTTPTTEKTIRVLLKEHTDRIRMTASAHGITVLQNGSADPICKLARLLLQKGVDSAVRLTIVRPDGHLMRSPSVKWWAERTTVERKNKSVEIVRYKGYDEQED